MSCPYRFLFGEPNKGFHSTRLFGFAVGDTLGTILLAWVIAWGWNLHFWKTLFWTFVIGEILHYLFGTQTAFLTMIGVRVNC